MFVGVNRRSGDVFVVGPDGFVKARSVKRCPEGPARWGRRNLQIVNVVPWDMWESGE